MTFNSRGRTEVDALIYEAAQKPGPGAYTIPTSLTTSGGRFNMSRPKSDVEVMMRVAR